MKERRLERRLPARRPLRALRRFLLFGGAMQWLAQRPWGRRLLLAFPRLFSFGLFRWGGQP